MTDYVDAAASEYGEAVASAGLSPADEARHLLAYAPLVKRIVRQLGSQVSGAQIGRAHV